MEFKITGKALMPYAPVSVTASRQSDGILITFMRRGRLDSDGWEPVDIPLGEESEAYALDIYSGNSIVRTLSASGTQLLYSNAEQLLDFGIQQSCLNFSLYQLSAAVGRGFPLTVTVSVH